MLYQYKFGARCPVPAQVAGEECARLEAQGRLTPHDLVEESRPEDAPLHKAFEWNDAIAAERYRETQAGYIIRSVEVVMEEASEPVRAFVSVVEESQRSYQSIEVVMRDANSREALLESARRELAAFQRKYESLTELADVFEAIKELAA